MATETAWRLLGNAEDTEECVQDALLDAFKLHHRENVENWGGILRQLTSRRAIDRLRARKPDQQLRDEIPGQRWQEPPSIAMQKELAQRLRAAVARLPDQQASVFALQVFGEMSRAEVAATLCISENAVGVALHKARSKLKSLLMGQPPGRDGDHTTIGQEELS